MQKEKKQSKTIFVFGNPDLKNDSLGVKLLPKLRKKFPEINFVHLDPLEYFEIPENFIIIDVIKGIKKVKIFSNLSLIKQHQSLSLHDFDLGSELFLLKKIGKLHKIKIIGLPMRISPKKGLDEIKDILEKL